jgi:hypothetical protein
MVVESFLLFLTTLISLNTPAETQVQQKEPQTQVRNHVVPETNNPNNRCHGGWDGN